MSKKEGVILKKLSWDDAKSYGFITILSVFSFLFLMWIFTGKGPFDANTYNSYALQADSWRQGRLHLAENYSWLELAVYEGRYYVSFPPFPSYLLFPFTFLFGSQTPDNLILCMAIAVSVIYLYRLGLLLGIKEYASMLGTLLVMIGSNQVFVMFDASVWFFAQTLCLMLSAMALFYAVKGKGGWSLFFWACAVGCRPMQVLMVPILLWILWEREKEREDRCVGAQGSILAFGKKILKWAPAPVVVALSYMILNFARFGNPLEFGHNYLLEFTQAEYGQFHVHYIKGNIGMLFNLPDFTEDGRMLIDHFGNLSVLIVSPIFVLFLCCFLGMLFKHKWKLFRMLGMILLLSTAYLLIVVMHRTMGGWHFGNRYTNDLLVWVYFGILLVQTKYPGLFKYQIPLLIFGMCLNAVGSIVVYNGWG